MTEPDIYVFHGIWRVEEVCHACDKPIYAFWDFRSGGLSVSEFVGRRKVESISGVCPHCGERLYDPPKTAVMRGVHTTRSWPWWKFRGTDVKRSFERKEAVHGEQEDAE